MATVLLIAGKDELSCIFYNGDRLWFWLWGELSESHDQMRGKVK